MNKILESDPVVIAAARKILFELGNLKSNEKLCIVTDSYTKQIGNFFLNLSNPTNTQIFEILQLKIHGEEPPENVAYAMSNSDLILGLTTNSMAHTKARLNATKNGVRYLSLPNFSLSLLSDKSLKSNFHKFSHKTKNFSELLSKTDIIHIKTKHGTDIKLDISNRISNFCPGFVNDKILLGSPPDIEANIPPNENKSNGKIVIDGSIPIEELGKISSPITLIISKGKIISIDGPTKNVQILNKLFNSHGESSKYLAELGIGFNENAEISGNMLIDEGAYGTVHFGFGSNITIGGQNDSSMHIDFVMYCNEIEFDGKKISL